MVGHARSLALLVALVSAPTLSAGCEPSASGTGVDASSTISDARAREDAGAPRDDAGRCAIDPLPADPHAQERSDCLFAAGASPEATLGIDAARAATLPIDHVVIVMQENRSFDHYFATYEGDLIDPLPATFSNPDDSGTAVAPFPLDSHCLPHDPPHQWDAMHASWNGGAMDGFVREADDASSDGHYVMGYFEPVDRPFYDWLAHTYAISDRHFGDALGGTWSNRAFLYTGSSHGIHSTGELTIPDARTVFDQLDDAGVSWGVFTSGAPRQDLLGWNGAHAGVATFNTFLARLADGTLPAVSFVDPSGIEDEHPANDIGGGEQWSRRIYEGAIASPLWPSLVIFLTYDESGGLFDHVAPPSACLPDPTLTEFDRLGIRVPLYVVSPWVRPARVGHETSSHASILRFVQLRFGLPALSARDANAGALLDFFDFCQPSFPVGPSSPAAFGLEGCGR